MIAKNNPFNIRYSKRNNWKGQIGLYRGFAEFETIDLGLRAGLNLLVNYVRKGFNTIEDIINRYAPPTENDTVRYIKFVEDSVKHDLSCYPSIVTYYDVCVLASAILIYENSYCVSVDTLTSYMRRFVLPDDVSIFEVIPCVHRW